MSQHGANKTRKCRLHLCRSFKHSLSGQRTKSLTPTKDNTNNNLTPKAKNSKLADAFLSKVQSSLKEQSELIVHKRNNIVHDNIPSLRAVKSVKGMWPPKTKSPTSVTSRRSTRNKPEEECFLSHHRNLIVLFAPSLRRN